MRVALVQASSANLIISSRSLPVSFTDAPRMKASFCVDDDLTIMEAITRPNSDRETVLNHEMISLRHEVSGNGAYICQNPAMFRGRWS